MMATCQEQNLNHLAINRCQPISKKGKKVCTCCHDEKDLTLFYIAAPINMIFYTT